MEAKFAWTRNQMVTILNKSKCSIAAAQDIALLSNAIKMPDL
jgi:hypothetical protein